LRRGAPGSLQLAISLTFLVKWFVVTHKIYGIPQTINTANYVYFLAYQELFSLRGSTASAQPRQALDALVTGRGPQLAFGHS